MPTKRIHGASASVAIGLLALGFLNVARAHTGTGLAGGFESGFEHPLQGFDHFLAMICVGIWGAALGRPLIYILPMVFPAVMAVGSAMAMLGVPLPPVETGVALSVLVLGGCIALSYEAPVWKAALIVGMFAVFHGYAHGKELPSAADPVGYSTGFVLVTGLLHIFGIGIGFLRSFPLGRMAMRGVGGIVAFIGGWLVYRSVGLL